MLNEAIALMPQVFSPQILTRAMDYEQNGAVLNAKLSDGLIKARVKGQHYQIYDVHIDLKKWPNKPSECTCSYQHNCKHAAASFLSLQHKNTSVEPSWMSWVKNLGLEEKKASAPVQKLFYILSIEAITYDFSQLIVNLALAKIKKNGELGQKTEIRSLTPKRRDQLSKEDVDILSKLLFLANESYDAIYDIPLDDAELLTKILQTGQAIGLDDLPITFSENIPVQPKWAVLPDGQQRLLLNKHTKDLKVIHLKNAVAYFDEEKGIMGFFESSKGYAYIKKILEAPELPPEAIETLIQTISKQDIELPKPLEIIKLPTNQELKPKLHIMFAEWERFRTSIPGYVYSVHMYIRYGDVIINTTTSLPTLYIDYHDKCFKVERDLALETSIIEQGMSMIPVQPKKISDKDIYSYLDYFDAPHLARLADDTSSFWLNIDKNLPFDEVHTLLNSWVIKLKSDGVSCEFYDDFFTPYVDMDSYEWFTDLNASDENFFSYDLGILIDGKSMSILPMIVSLLKSHTLTSLDAMSDEELVYIEHEKQGYQVTLGRIKPLIRLIYQIGFSAKDGEDKLILSRYQMLLIEEVEAANKAIASRYQNSISIGKQLEQLIQKSNRHQFEAPKQLNAELRDYQQLGVQWLQQLREGAMSGVLADDMGLGKTVQTLAHLAIEQEQGRLTMPVLIVAPTSLVINWQLEVQKFTPNLSCLVYHGQDRHEIKFEDYQLIVTTYGIIQRDKTKFLDTQFYYLILDEAQFIKNAQTKTTQIIQQLNAKYRLCLSGTPLENHLGELWSLFHFLMPGLLGDKKIFTTLFRNPIEREKDIERQQLLAGRIKPFLLRRTKNEVARELPPKTEIIQTVEIEGKQRDLYEAIRLTMEKKVRDAISSQGLNRSHIVILDALLKLRQVCCDPRLLKLDSAKIAHGESAKLEAFMTLLENLVDEGRRVLVFSQFTSMLALLEDEIKAKKYPYLKLTGATKNRQQLVNDFQSGEYPVFLISLKAGGTGLNLTKADTVIHYDPWWNPQVEDQATDRAHRIGQDNPVFVYKFITQGTVEEVILSLQSKKRALFEGILSDNAEGLSSLSQDDIKALFKAI